MQTLDIKICIIRKMKSFQNSWYFFLKVIDVHHENERPQDSSLRNPVVDYCSFWKHNRLNVGTIALERLVGALINCSLHVGGGGGGGEGGED